MKILFLSAANNIHTVRWVNALIQRGHHVVLATNANHFSGADRIDSKVKIVPLKYSGTLGYYLNAVQLNRLYRTFKPDIVNAHYASGYGTLARMAKVRPLVLSVWGSDVYDFPYQSDLKMRIIKKNLRYADQLASTSHSMARQVEKLLGEKIDIEITPFGVDTDLFKPIVDIEKSSTFVFGTVKALKPKYGIEYIIRGFGLLLTKLSETNPTINLPILRIYGKGELEGELKELCAKLGIEKQVSFEGYIQNTLVAKAINEMDVFCLASVLDSESFGVAAVEAMACEVPVIATQVSGFEEVIEDQVTGILVPIKDENMIADKMLYCFQNPSRRIEMGKNGRKRVLAMYDWHQNVTMMEEVYQKTIEKTDK